MKAALKHYTKLARAAGLPVRGGQNGGGWVRLAAALGVKCDNKAEAKAALRWHFDKLEPVKKPAVAKPEAFATSDGFLSSYEWRRVRMEALKKHGARCQCCGATPADGVKMNVDHIKPRRLFPQLALDVNNLQVLCNDCNHGKGNWDMTDWRGQEQELTPEQAQHMKDILS